MGFREEQRQLGCFTVITARKKKDKRLTEAYNASQVALVVKTACNRGDVGDAGLIPGSGRYPGEGNGNPVQYACWEISWTEEPTVHGAEEPDTSKNNAILCCRL